ncbi:Site-specific recombinase XerD [Prauserella aidingensis]|uniref:tyrosine-type recombinase/integrase n=1 Tax=Prauserella aidingensis TaxID=387890 RepID=UPI0020A3F917|nr:tyrosine-type recombinase/integrase [Prauserella aidingensis]MCP2255686.1 Site-specific recombinase XerD [Prauserella aidingensis]
MANKKGRRSFGNVRQLPSKRWQARYPGPDGVERLAPYTFDTRRAAERWLAMVETQINQGDWVDPEKGKIELADYARQWIQERPDLRPRTVDLYEWLLTKHVAPDLGGVQLGKLSTAVIRQWRARRLSSGVSQSVTAKAYRFLRAVLTTAVDEDNILQRNPCRIRGADKESPAERPTLSIAQVFQLADKMPARFRALVLLTAFTSLRWGEATALRRCDVAEDASWVRVSRQFVEVRGQGLVEGPPKSRAGAREVIVPAAVRDDVLEHVAEYVDSELTALLFTGERSGNAIRRPNFNQRVKWTKVVADIGLEGLHFHDLRHAGNVWASKTGMSTKDLMARMGHDDMRAALIYQRATDEAGQRIADQLSGLVEEYRERRGGDDDEPGDGGAGQPAPVG